MVTRSVLLSRHWIVVTMSLARSDRVSLALRCKSQVGVDGYAGDVGLFGPVNDFGDQNKCGARGPERFTNKAI